MSIEEPHITVAVVVERGGRYLLVEERDKRSGAMVFNQPAGHVEPGESLHEAALRETLEETGCIVTLQAVLSVSLYDAPNHPGTYLRTTFLADLREQTDRPLDPDITAVHWLSFEEITLHSDRMRSPLVLASVERHRANIHFPLDLIYPHEPKLGQ